MGLRNKPEHGDSPAHLSWRSLAANCFNTNFTTCGLIGHSHVCSVYGSERLSGFDIEVMRSRCSSFISKR